MISRPAAPRRSGFTALALLAGFALSACGGGGGGSGGGGGITPPPPATNVTVSGKITFDRIPFKAQLNQGLNPAATVQSPARLVVVEAISTNGATLASTTTNDTGDYSLTVASSTTVTIRVKAQMLKTGTAPTWNFRVLNNTNSGALYAIVSASFNTGTANVVRNLNAASGFGTTSYTGERAAAPFAILDTVYSARQLVLSAVANAAFPDLNLYWSATNKPTVGTLCPDTGDIGTTFYLSPNSGNDDCVPSKPLPEGIYILGDVVAGDTDEFDQHVIAHEFGHYLEGRFSRTDTIGGDHGITDKVDMRLAYSEGWGNAYSAMALNDPQYRDSFAVTASDSGFNLESDVVPQSRGWYSEQSIGSILWDIFDPTGESGDNVALGFAPIFAVMTDSQRTSNALTSIFQFADALRSANPGSATGINALLARESISTGSDAFGSAEVNTGGSTTAIPIYRDITLNQPLPAPGVCTTSSAGSTNGNKLGNRRFLRLTLATAATVTITATGVADPATAGSAAATDPDLVLYRQGFLLRSDNTSAPAPAIPTETISQRPLAAGVYIIEAYDFDSFDKPGTSTVPRCMTVSVQGM